MSPRRPAFVGVPTVDDVQVHCQRVRAAGSPNARARASLVTEYRRIAEALDVAPEVIETGLDLQRASAALLRTAAYAEQAAARSPRRHR